MRVYSMGGGGGSKQLFKDVNKHFLKVKVDYCCVPKVGIQVNLIWPFSLVFTQVAFHNQHLKLGPYICNG